MGFTVEAGVCVGVVVSGVLEAVTAGREAGEALAVLVVDEEALEETPDVLEPLDVVVMATGVRV